jgi:dihydrofolate reductase
VDHRDPNEYILDVDWCIGGKKTYEKYCQYFTELHISYVNNNKIGDVRYPELKLLNPECKTFNYYFE